MAGDINSSLPVRGATGDLLVSLFDYAGATFNPATKELQESILAGVTGLEASNISILAGVTGLEASSISILAGVTGLEASAGLILAGVTGLEASSVSILAGVTAIEANSVSILAGVTGLEETATSILVGVTGLEASAVSILAGVTGLEATAVSILTGVTGLQAQLPAELGATDSDGSLSVTLATDQSPMPVYITTAVVGAPLVQFATDNDVAAGDVLENEYVPGATMTLDRVQASATGRVKVEVFVGATGDIGDPDTLRWVGFNSTANPNVNIDCSEYRILPTEEVKVVVTNYESATAQALYSTIVGNL